MDDTSNAEMPRDDSCSANRSVFARRFRLRTFFIIFSIVCVLSGTYAAKRFREYKEELAVKTVRSVGGVALAGKDGHVYRVMLRGEMIDDQAFQNLFPHLLYLPQLKELDFVKSPITDEGIRPVGKLRGLEELYLYQTAVTADGREAVTREHPELAIKLVKPDPVATTLAAQKIYGHAINTIAMNPSGKDLVVGNGDGELFWWRESDSLVKKKAHSDWLFATAFSHDGRWLATGGGDGATRLWDVNARKLVRFFESHVDDVHALGFSPNDEWLYSVSDDMTIQRVAVRDVESSDPDTVDVLTLGEHEETIPCLAVGPLGDIVASGSRDDTISLWDAKKGGLVRKLTGHSDDVMSVAFTPDGKSLVSASYDGSVRLWDVATGETVRIMVGHQGRAYAVAISENGKTIASGGKDGVIIWNRDTGRVRWKLNKLENVSSVLFDGDELVAADAKGTVRFIHIWRGNVVRRLETSKATFAARLK